MAYDAMDRLTYANIPGHGASTWAYDPLDNIRSVTTAPTAGPAYTRSYLYDGSNRLTRINQDGATWGVGTYDARGNLINRNGQVLNFDRASRLTSIPGVANYEYDGHGRRRRTAQWRADGTVRVSLYTLDGRLQGEADNRAVGSTDYIYLGGTLVAKRFQHWSGIPPVVTYLHSDGLGSPVLETDATGAVLSRERFLSYGGAADGAVKDAVGYTGHQEDPASGLVYMQQRYYDPAIGRFLSVDPMAADMQTGWNFHRYWYANNNPYRFTDPDGRQAVDDFGNPNVCGPDCVFTPMGKNGERTWIPQGMAPNIIGARNSYADSLYEYNTLTRKDAIDTLDWGGNAAGVMSVAFKGVPAPQAQAVSTGLAFVSIGLKSLALSLDRNEKREKGLAIDAALLGASFFARGLGSAEDVVDVIDRGRVAVDAIQSVKDANSDEKTD